MLIIADNADDEHIATVMMLNLADDRRLSLKPRIDLTVNSGVN